MFKNFGCEIVFELQVNAYKTVIISSTIKNEDTSYCNLTFNLNFFAAAYRFIRKSFKVKVPTDPFHQNLSDFFRRKEVLYRMVWYL